LKAERAGAISAALKTIRLPEICRRRGLKRYSRCSIQRFVEDSSLQPAIDEAKTLSKITKPIPQTDLVDYSFQRAALKK
jgi:hypothetical protein